MSDENNDDQAAKEAAEKAEAEAKAKADAEAEAQAKKDADDEAFDKDRAMNTIKQQRDEAKALRAELKAAKEKAEKFDAAEAEKLSEQEKLAKRAAEAEAKVADAENKLRQANLLVALSNPEHGIVSAQAAARLLDGVEYDDNGQPSNLKEILPGFLEANAFLKGEPAKARPSGDLNAGAGNRGGDAPKLTEAELDMAEKSGMSPEEYSAFKDVGTHGEYVKAQERLKAGTG